VFADSAPVVAFSRSPRRLARAACEGGDGAVFHLLGQTRGAFVRTMMHHAASTLHVPSVLLLLERGANAAAVDVLGRTPLAVAAAVHAELPAARRAQLSPALRGLETALRPRVV